MHCWLSKTLRFLRTRTTFSKTTKRTRIIGLSSIIERNHKNEEVRSRQSHPEEDSLTWERGMERNGERERKRERERRGRTTVQLNCYDIIRVDPMFGRCWTTRGRGGERRRAGKSRTTRGIELNLALETIHSSGSAVVTI